MIRAAAVALAVIAAGAASVRAEPTAIMVLPADGAPVDAAVTGAIVRGARAVSPTATAGSASLADTAFIAGCDPAEPPCLDAVGAQLGVQQLVVVRTRVERGATTVDVTATRRGGAPVHRIFTGSLGELEAAMPALLGATTATTAPTSSHAARRTPRAALAVTITGAAALVVGLGLWAGAASDQSAIDDAPTATPDDLEHLVTLERHGRTYASVGNGLVIAGSITAAAGLGWLLWDRGRRRDAVRLTPTAGAHGAGVALEGRW